jgi:hypothetical protein
MPEIYLGKKVDQNVAISLGYFILSKNFRELPKVAKVEKCPIWSPCPYLEIDLKIASYCSTVVEHSPLLPKA